MICVNCLCSHLDYVHTSIWMCEWCLLFYLGSLCMCNTHTHTQWHIGVIVRATMLCRTAIWEIECEWTQKRYISQFLANQKLTWCNNRRISSYTMWLWCCCSLAHQSKTHTHIETHASYRWLMAAKMPNVEPNKKLSIGDFFLVFIWMVLCVCCWYCLCMHI